jgi:hypothetical protein
LALSGLPRQPADGELLALVAAVFARTKVRGAIIGGVARNEWTVPRMTFDLDFTVVADPAAERAFVEAMQAAGFTVMREQAAGAPSGPDFIQLYNYTTHHTVEFQAAKTDYQAELVARAVPVEGLAPLCVATREDLLVLKLLAFRPKDQGDMREIAKAPGIDWAYVDKWAAEWGTLDRLAWLRQELGEPPSA